MALKIGTRKSRLALAQAELVREAVLAHFPDAQVELVLMGSPGDRAQERELESFGGKGAFTQDLERALLSGEIDLAVHSAKDLPVELPEGLSYRAALGREDPADVLVTVSGVPAAELPAGSVIGSGSLRRGLLLKQINPQVRMKLLRGNVPTRLQKLRDGQYDGILLAAAGLSRLGLQTPEGLHVEPLDQRIFLPAPGQGILCAEFRTGELTGLLDALCDEETGAALAAEREFLRVMGGGCNAPCAAWCRREADELRMDVMFAADGKHPVYAGGSAVFPVFQPDRVLQKQMLKESALDLARQLAARVRLQPVALVGAGPGNAGLITERGLACIRRAQVLVYDNLIPASLINEAPLDAKLLYVGKRSGAHAMTQEKINALLVREAQTGAYVVRLKGGDPFVFGRGGEEALALREQGIPFEIVPGVTSACAAPAFAGIPVTSRGYASSLHIITGHEGSGKTGFALDYGTLAREEGTLVFLMGFSRLAEIAEKLIACGKAPETPAAVVERGSMPGQKKARAALKDIAREAGTRGLQAPAVLVVGGTAALGDQLEWFGNGPLSGVRVLATGTRRFCAELEAELSPLGAQTEAVSLIESVRIRGGADSWKQADATMCALRELSRYTWLVFTSANGVELFFSLLTEERIDLRRLSNLKFAVIGSGTAQALAAHGFLADFVPAAFSSEALAAEWIPMLGKTDRVLLMRARGGSPVLPEQLLAAGISFTDVPLYENRVDARRGGELCRLVKEVDYMVFASASAARAAAELLAGAGDSPFELSAKVIAIGLHTARAAREAGFAVRCEAVEYTVEGIAAAILADLRHGGLVWGAEIREAGYQPRKTGEETHE